jgi:hypothetical protein
MTSHIITNDNLIPLRTPIRHKRRIRPRRQRRRIRRLISLVLYQTLRCRTGIRGSHRRRGCHNIGRSDARGSPRSRGSSRSGSFPTPTRIDIGKTSVRDILTIQQTPARTGNAFRCGVLTRLAAEIVGGVLVVSLGRRRCDLDGCRTIPRGDVRDGIVVVDFVGGGVEELLPRRREGGGVAAARCCCSCSC